MSLQLDTPDAFPAFPYDPPYSIQVDLMRHLYTSIEQKAVTIVESPTGTVIFSSQSFNIQTSSSLESGKNVISALCGSYLAFRREGTCTKGKVKGSSGRWNGW